MKKPDVLFASLLAALAVTAVGLGLLVSLESDSDAAHVALLEAIERTKSSRSVRIEVRGPDGRAAITTDYQAPDRLRQTTHSSREPESDQFVVTGAPPDLVLIVLDRDSWSIGYTISTSGTTYDTTYEHCVESRSGAAQSLAFRNLTYLVEHGREFKVTRESPFVTVTFAVSVPTPEGEQVATGVVRMRDGRVAELRARGERQSRTQTLEYYSYEERADPIEPPPAELVTSSQESCEDED